MDFEAFPKIPRLRRDCVITEKIDGTNAAVVIEEDRHGVWLGSSLVEHVDGYAVFAQSRSRFIIPEADNFGFARWVRDNAGALVRILGEGRHFGEWWGRGIQRGYGLDHKRFSLFNADRYAEAVYPSPSTALDGAQIGVVPVLYEGTFCDLAVDKALVRLSKDGSFAAPGFTRPEGIVIWHEAASQLFKVTLKHDEAPKGGVG